MRFPIGPRGLGLFWKFPGHPEVIRAVGISLGKPLSTPAFFFFFLGELEEVVEAFGVKAPCH
jgi:hypothetical protein